jgi:hypothetical protein
MQRIVNNMSALEWIGVNALNLGALGLIHYIPTLITCTVGLTIIVLNGIKIYKELKK